MKSRHLINHIRRVGSFLRSYSVNALLVLLVLLVPSISSASVNATEPAGAAIPIAPNESLQTITTQASFHGFIENPVPEGDDCDTILLAPAEDGTSAPVVVGCTHSAERSNIVSSGSRPEDVPPAPHLISPANGSQLDTLVPRLRIDPRITGVDIGAAVYWSRDPNFGSWEGGVIFCNRPGSWVDSFSTVPYYNLGSNTRYYWRARSSYDEVCGGITPQWGPWSTIYSFTTGSGGQILPAPTLSFPANNATLASQGRRVFAWERVSGAIDWRMRISRTDGQQIITGNCGYQSGCSEAQTCSMIPFGLSEGYSYDWYVEVRDHYAWSPRSVTRRFTAGSGTDYAHWFCPSLDGYGFSNGDDGWGEYPYSAYDFGTPELIRMFGRNAVCIPVPGPDCYMKPEASRWLSEANRSMNGGHCDGMAVTSLRFFRGLDLTSNYQLGARYTNELRLENVRYHIAYYTVLQSVNPVSAYKDWIRRNSLTYIIQQIRSAMTGYDLPDPNTLFIRGPDPRTGRIAGHAVTPFAVEQKANGLLWVRVYDNNHPYDLSRYLIIDPNRQVWSYHLGGNLYWSGDTNTMTLGAVPISKYAEQPICPWCGTARQSGVDSTTRQQVWLNGGGSLLITDTQGRRLGYDGDQFVDEIPNAYPNFIDGGLGVAFEPIYDLPSGESYAMLLDGQSLLTTENTSISQFGSGYAVGIDNIALSPDSQDRLSIAADGASVTFEPGGPRSISVTLAREEDGTNYELQIVGADTQAGKAVTVSTNSVGQLVFSQAQGNEDSYGLRIRRLDSSGIVTFRYGRLMILEGDTHYLEYANWTGSMPLVMHIDHGSNGTIDETLFLSSQDNLVYLPIVTSQ